MAPGKATLKSPPRKKGPASPPRRKNAGLPERKKKITNQLTVRAFQDPFSFEMYIFQVGEGKDGFLNNIRMFINDELKGNPQMLMDANVTRLAHRRIPFSNNEAMMNGIHERQVIVTYPRELKSTSETRAKGLQQISSFFMDPKFARFPPSAIEQIDMTDEEDPSPLDEFFMDDEIEAFMKHEFEEENLDTDVVKNFPELAAKCWSGTHVSDFARSLGFD